MASTNPHPRLRGDALDQFLAAGIRRPKLALVRDDSSQRDDSNEHAEAGGPISGPPTDSGKE